MVHVVRPTLIAAIGGTGTAAAKAARARMEHFIGPRHHFIAFRAFDTAFQDNREPRLVDNSEYVYLGGFNAQSVIADIVAGRAFPHWARWLPPHLNFQQVAFGAGGIRPIGRLCYFYRRERVEAAVQEALSAITDSDLALRFHQQTGVRVNLEAGLDIHLIGSVCGGTGSGMFLDLAFDLRRWAEQHTNREVTVTGHLVLPEAFRGKPVVMKALEANAYTALQELDRYMNASSDDPWTAEYVQDRRERSIRAPFDHCYLLSGLQQGGTSDVETLTSVIGETITLLTLSQAGQKVSEGVINMAGQRKATRDELGRVCCYSSYGALGVEVPHELLGASLGPQLAEDLHGWLLQGGGDSEAESPGDLATFKNEVRIVDLTRIDAIVPQVNPDLATVHAMMSGDKRRQEMAKSELQRALVEAREQHRRELRRAAQENLWDEAGLRRHLKDHVRVMLSRPGGLDRGLRYLSRCVEALRAFQARLRERIQEAEAEAERSHPAAESLERSSVAGKELRQLLDSDLPQWTAHVQSQAVALLCQEQLRRIDRLAQIVEGEFAQPWIVIRRLLATLRRTEPLDEESYYRAHRGRASVGPLSWFERHLIEPNKERLLRRVLERLIDEPMSWSAQEPKELNEHFASLCTEEILHYFRSESGMTCDQLLAECHGHPGEKYKTEVAVLLARAQANWELHESYSMRDNRLEISCVGVQVDSKLYEAVRASYRQFGPVDEQRPDYIPILRTEHGLSLQGLKSLAMYREALVASVVEEQRYDFHFFNDRRWVTRLEFAGEDREVMRCLYLFSAADMLQLLKRSDGRGYVDSASVPLGLYRRQAFLTVCGDQRRLAAIEQEVAVRSEQEGDWRRLLEKQIAELERRVATAADPSRAAHPFLSLDIYQLHAEIRALKYALRVEVLGL